MLLSEFDFDLPDELIALRPVRPRPASRLLVSGPGQTDLTTVSKLGDFLRPGDMLVFNDTKVLPARLAGVRIRGDLRAGVELTLVKHVGVKQTGAQTWTAMAKPARKLKPGDLLEFPNGLSAICTKDAVEGIVEVQFEFSASSFEEALALSGTMPLPPYIAGKRAPDAQDTSDYQPVFARAPGAIASPTASLHFDDGLLDALAEQGVLFSYVTLHVGIGTFLPVKVDDIADHKMHSEWGEITPAAAEAINAAKARGGRIIPVGTTAMRLIETAARGGTLQPLAGETDIFITPGFDFQIADGLMTNFHLPKSTLLMLVAALIGTQRMHDVYATAIQERFRFFSYGDSSLLFPSHR